MSSDDIFFDVLGFVAIAGIIVCVFVAADEGIAVWRRRHR